jgi:hypothetical protein
MPVGDSRDVAALPLGPRQPGLSLQHVLTRERLISDDLFSLGLPAPKLTPVVRLRMDRCADAAGGSSPTQTSLPYDRADSGSVNEALGGLSRLVIRDFARRNWPLDWVPSQAEVRPIG